VQAVCKLTGNPDDPAKSLDLFKTSPVEVQRETFLWAAAKDTKALAAKIQGLVKKLRIT